MALPEPIDEPVPPLGGADTIAAILAVANENPSRAWRTSELIHRLDSYRVLNIILAVAELHHLGGLERVGPATYRAPTRGRKETRAMNEARMWG